MQRCIESWKARLHGDCFASQKDALFAEAKIKCDRVDSTVIAELTRLEALPLAYMPEKKISNLREQVRRRAFFVRERVKLRVKVKSVLTYEGIKWPTDHGLFTEKGVLWLHSLNLEPVESYLRVLGPLNDEIRLVSSKLKGIADDDEDMKLLMTIPGIGYYSALLVKSEIGDINRFPFGERLCSYLVLCRQRLHQGQWLGTGTSLRRVVVGCVGR